ncbi:MAG: efflux RND transporter periplasmic adaptor subunit, partial [Acidobacteriota bacterium]
FRLSFFGALAAIVLVAGYVMFSNVFRSEAAIPNDRLAEVKRGDFAMSVVATGAIEPVATVEIKSKASGLIKEIYVDDGDTVSQGQILVELDKEMLEAQLREAEANKQAAAAQLAEAHSDHSSAQSMKKKLEMDLRNLEDKVAYLQKQVARYEALYSEWPTFKSRWPATRPSTPRSSFPIPIWSRANARCRTLGSRPNPSSPNS